MTDRKVVKSSSTYYDLAQSLYLRLVNDTQLWAQSRQLAFNVISESILNALSVARVGIWLFSETNELKCIHFRGIESAGENTNSRIRRHEFPAYFTALSEGRVIDAHDAYTDPRTRGFSTSYLRPNGIGAILDATIRTTGAIKGVLSIEHLNGARLWSKEEKTVAQCMADLIAQVLMHHQLRSATENYESLLSHMPSAAYRCRCDDVWAMEYVSAGVQGIIGYSPAELTQAAADKYWQMMHPEDRKKVRESVYNAVRHQKKYDLKYRLVDAQGQVCWVHDRGRGEYNTNGQVLFLEGVISDITQQVKTEQSQLETNDIVTRLSRGISRTSGQAFFKALTQQLVELLNVDYAVVAKCYPRSFLTIETLCIFSSQGYMPNYSFDALETPCAEVLHNKLTCYPEGVQSYFPRDGLLQEMAIVGYLGTPLVSADGEVLGIMHILQKDPILNVELAQGVLSIFAARASSELERQISEQKLVTSQKYYQGLFDAAGDTIFLVQKGVFIDCNSTAMTMFGCQRSDIIGRSPIELSPKYQPSGELSCDLAQQKIDRALAGQKLQFEWVHIRRDGSAFEAEVMLNCLDIDGRLTLLSVVRDVSARKRAERTVKQRDQQLNASIESLPGIFYMFDDRFRVVHFNRAYLQMLGITAEETRGLHGLKYVHDDDRESVKAAFCEVMERGKTIQIQLRVVSNRGRGPVAHVLATGSRTVLGGKRYLVGAAIDIGERVAAEHALAQSKKALQQRNQNLLLLNSLSNTLQGVHSEEVILTKVVEKLAAMVHSPIVVLMMFEQETQKLRLVKAANLPDHISFSGFKLRLDGSLAGAALRERCMQIADDIRTDQRQLPSLRKTKIDMLGVESEVSLPLFSHDRPLGAISLMYRDGRNFSKIEAQTLASIANNISISIVNARHHQKLEFQARHDPLTNLYNRAALHHKMDVLLNKRHQGDKGMALMLIDLDRFKEVNDTLGHDLGDQLICAIGPRILQALQNQGVFLSRLGGDEFALLVDDIDDVHQVSDLAVKVLRAIRDPLLIEGVALEVGASIGIAISSPDLPSREELLRRADVAMYHAKKSGVGYCFYEGDIDHHSREKLLLISQLRRAVDEDQFVLHYQPKLNLQTRKVIGFEALIRWQHPERGLIYPDEFIPLVEMSDLIHPLTELAIRKAIEQITIWNGFSSRKLTMAVNISTRNLLDNDFPAKLAGIIDQSGFNAQWLELEITESMLISDPLRSLNNLHTISELGVQLSIDDFGTGYSSLSYLKQLPIQTLKIDRSFVSDMTNNSHDETIVKSTIALAHNLGLSVIAEGVEHGDVLEKLEDFQCDCAQGYCVSRPVAASELTDVLKASC